MGNRDYSAHPLHIAGFTDAEISIADSIYENAPNRPQTKAAYYMGLMQMKEGRKRKVIRIGSYKRR